MEVQPVKKGREAGLHADHGQEKGRHLRCSSSPRRTRQGQQRLKQTCGRVGTEALPPHVAAACCAPRIASAHLHQNEWARARLEVATAPYEQEGTEPKMKNHNIHAAKVRMKGMHSHPQGQENHASTPSSKVFNERTLHPSWKRRGSVRGGTQPDRSEDC